MVLPFGKHRGEDVEDVPSDYLQWFLTNVSPPGVGDPARAAFLDLVSEMESELASRHKYGSAKG